MQLVWHSREVPRLAEDASMRKLKQILVIDQEMYPGNLMALDDNGELWHGTLETTDDNRRVIDWTPVNTPKDGAAYSEPQLDFFDKWEKEAHARIQADIDSGREVVSLETETKADASGTGETVQDSSDDGVEDGEGSDPREYTRCGDAVGRED